MGTMKRQPYPIFILIFGLIVCPHVSAQEADFDIPSAKTARVLSNREWKETIGNVKAETQTLLENNEKLNAEYEVLQEKFGHVQDSVRDLRQEVGRQTAENDRIQKAKRRRESSATSRRDEVSRIESRVKKIETDNEQLKVDLDAQISANEALESQVSDLQARRREILLDLKLQEFNSEEVELEESEELEDLKAKLKVYQKEELELEKLISKLYGKKQEMVDAASQMAQDNKKLESEIGELKKQRDDQQRANRIQAKENDSMSALATRVPGRLIKEKRGLKAEIARYEREIERIKTSVEKSSSVLEQKRTLMDDIMRKDAENQVLRDQISDMMDDVSGLKKEIEVLSTDM